MFKVSGVVVDSLDRRAQHADSQAPDSILLASHDPPSVSQGQCDVGSE